MSLLPADTPLYNHPLPQIERWLTTMGCYQDTQQLHYWTIERLDWQAELALETEEIIVCYHPSTDKERSITRAFKYSLSRQDIEDAIFAGP